MKNMSWQCPKCNRQGAEVGQFAATGGGFFSKIFDIQNKKFSTVSCKHCHFTEVYKVKASKLGDVFDFLIGS